MKKLMLTMLLIVGALFQAQSKQAVINRFEIYTKSDCIQIFAIRDYEKLTNEKSASYEAWNHLLTLKRCNFRDYERIVKLPTQKPEPLKEAAFTNEWVEANKERFKEIKENEAFFKILFQQLYKKSIDSLDEELAHRTYILNYIGKEVGQKDYENFGEFFQPIKLTIQKALENAPLPVDTTYKYTKLKTTKSDFSGLRSYKTDSDFYYDRNGNFTKKATWTKELENEINDMKISQNFCVRLLIRYNEMIKEALPKNKLNFSQKKYNELSEKATNTYFTKYLNLVNSGQCTGRELQTKK